MPTTHRRHAVTETAEIAKALDAARRAWPHLADRPSALLRELIVTGERSIDDVDARRLSAIDAAGGSLTGTFSPGALDDLRQDWPE